MSALLIPDEALDRHIGVLGQVGTGKTYSAKGLVERLLTPRRPVVIIDPTGAWYGLRSAFEIPIFGGPHGDVPIGEDSGEAVAATITAHGTSAIVDLSQIAKESAAAMRRFMSAFVHKLKNRPDGALWLVIDEADEFLPQMLPKGMERLFGDLRWIVRRGRLAGWRVVMVTQRPQEIAKAVLSQVQTLITHQLIAPHDRKAVEEWIKGNASEGRAREVLGTLAGLKKGEAWVLAPSIDLLERGNMPAITSFDSSATPDAASGELTQPRLATIDMTAIRATLEQQGAAKRSARSRSALDAGKAAGEALKQRDDRIAELEHDLASARAMGDALYRRGLVAGLHRAGDAIAALCVEDSENAPVDAATVAAVEAAIPGIAHTTKVAPVSATIAVARSDARRSKRQSSSTGERAVGAAVSAGKTHPLAERIVAKLEEHAPAAFTWKQVASLLGYKPDGGYFRSGKRDALASGRLVETGADMVRAAIDVQGLTRMDAYALWETVLLSPAPAIMEVLKNNVDGIATTCVAGALGYEPTGGYFRGGLKHLRQNGVIEERKGLIRLASPLPGEAP